MKICIQSQNEGWVLDEIARDFIRGTRHNIVGMNESPDLIWAINPFIFSSFCNVIPSTCRTVIQIHHIDADKLVEYDFNSFNRADFCMVPNRITKDAVGKYLKIPVAILPYWLLSKNMAPKNIKEISAMKAEICPSGELLIGSFVKDGNGRVGDTPKSAKNPDLFLEIIKRLSSIMKIKVLLAGYAREYVKNRLSLMKIPYVYYQKYSDTNILYDCLDWYFVTSKYEGGPQSVLETSYRKVKILSTNVGMVSGILDNDCICASVDEFVKKVQSNVDRTEQNYSAVRKYTSDIIIPKYDDYFEKCFKGDKYG